MKPREIVHVVPALFGHRGLFGGAERYAYELARAMAAVVETKLVSFGSDSCSWTDGPLNVEVLRGKPVRGQDGNPFSLRLARCARPRVVHVHQPYTAMGTFVAALRRSLRRPTFASDLGGGGWNLSSYVDTDGLFSGHLHISRYSRSLAKHSEARSRVISGGVDATKFCPSDIPRRPRSLVYVGRLLPHKGIDVLIRAMPEGASLRVIGRVSDHAYVAHLRDLARGKRVDFVDDASDVDIVRAYREACCAALLSVHVDHRGHHTLVPELLGQTPLEAMACGTPAVVSDAASLPEVVDDGVTGYVVRQHDVEQTRASLSRLLDDDRLRERLGAAGQTRVASQFSWEAVVQRCLRAYAELG